jgi:hypothetical protein
MQALLLVVDCFGFALVLLWLCRNDRRQDGGSGLFRMTVSGTGETEDEGRKGKKRPGSRTARGRRPIRHA